MDRLKKDTGGGLVSPTTMHSVKRFMGYHPEEELITRPCRQSSEGSIHRLVDAFESMRGIYRFAYQEAVSLVHGIPSSQKDLDSFLVYAVSMKDDIADEVKANPSFDSLLAIKFGTFISAMTNEGSEKAYTLDLRAIPFLVHRLGMYNRKELRVLGDCGNELGGYMKRGVIVLDGNAIGQHTASQMAGGTLTINGDVKQHDVFTMRYSGERIERWVPNPIGPIHGGEVRINGEFDVGKSLQSATRGRSFTMGN